MGIAQTLTRERMFERLRERLGGTGAAGQLEPFEVFRQEKKGQPFAHAGSVEAPDAAFADAWARIRSRPRSS